MWWFGNIAQTPQILELKIQEFLRHGEFVAILPKQTDANTRSERHELFNLLHVYVFLAAFAICRQERGLKMRKYGLTKGLKIGLILRGSVGV